MRQAILILEAIQGPDYLLSTIPEEIFLLHGKSWPPGPNPCVSVIKEKLLIAVISFFLKQIVVKYIQHKISISIIFKCIVEQH